MPSFVTTRGGIGYDLLPQYHERYSAQGEIEVTQLAVVQWTQRTDFIRALLPDVRATGEVGGDEILLHPVNITPPSQQIKRRRLRLERDLPEPHPVITGSGKRRLYAVAAEALEGVGWPTYREDDGVRSIMFQTGTADAANVSVGKAKVLVTYRTLPYAADVPDSTTNIAGASELLRYVSRQGSPAGDNLPIPGVQLKFLNANGSPIEPTRVAQNGLTKAICKTNYSYTWHMVPLVPRAAQVLLGHINAEADFDPESAINPVLREQVRRGTMLYNSNETSKIYATCTGTPVVDITYHLIFRFAGLGYNGATPFAIGHNFPLLPLEMRFARAAAGVGTAAGFGGPGGDDLPEIPTVGAAYRGTGLYPYAYLSGLFKMDGALIQVQ